MRTLAAGAFNARSSFRTMKSAFCASFSAWRGLIPEAVSEGEATTSLPVRAPSRPQAQDIGVRVRERRIERQDGPSRATSR